MSAWVPAAGYLLRLDGMGGTPVRARHHHRLTPVGSQACQPVHELAVHTVRIAPTLASHLILTKVR